MNTASPCILFSPDPELARRINAFLTPLTPIRTTESPAQLDRILDQGGPHLILMDLRTPASRELVRDIRKHHPDDLIVALGVPRSDPAREAQAENVYAFEDVKAERNRIQNLVERGLEQLRLVQENQWLSGAKSKGKKEPASRPAERSERPPPPGPLRHFSRAFRKFQNIEALLNDMVEGIASSMVVSRVGVFSSTRGDSQFRLRAGLRHLEETQQLIYPERDPLVRWLEIRACMISRSNLEHVESLSERIMLNQALDAMGAEVIIPMHGRGRLIGWIFVGHRSTGLPFDVSDLEELLAVAEHSSTILDNALLYEEVTLQKTLAETVLHSMPTGIVAVAPDGIVRWFNRAAELILDVSSSQVLGQRVETLGSRLADLLRRGLASEQPDAKMEWTDSLTKRSLSVQAVRLLHQDTCLGAVALIHDQTAEKQLREKEERVERASFWTDLAASISHEVRNPLVAIKTFAQLLPDRYNDKEFRGEFSVLVSAEVDRLNKIIEQINDFAHPPKLSFHPVNLDAALRKGLDIAKRRLPQNGIKIDSKLQKDLPSVTGDENALVECFAHLITNAMEASQKSQNPRILITAKPADPSHSMEGVTVTVEDNGKGIPDTIREKMFSPFCTTKARGIGLGLPIVKRTVVDHNGQLEINSSQKGTEVAVTLPKANGASPHEASSHN